jgi:hypothetical protein
MQEHARTSPPQRAWLAPPWAIQVVHGRRLHVQQGACTAPGDEQDKFSYSVRNARQHGTGAGGQISTDWRAS